METKSRIIGLTALTCIGMLTVQGAAAHDAGKANSGYVGENDSHLITDGFGNCVKTGFWSSEDGLADCGDKMNEEAAAEPAPAPAPVAAAPAPAPKVTTKSVSLSAGALFDVNSDVIKDAGKAELRALADHINKLADVQSVDIVGYTDSSGAADYNQKLSLRRATAVKNFLMDNGVSPKVMTTLGLGEEKPVASNATREGRAKNRRVEITIRGTQAQ
ncbi:OOP family OmpA-OmpF porin [Thiogranum longum]|uniref:OOP family OmpA-OmpF porin n=1 Tax=Thiogranum longum TaxID=1537524 RepID=A0A4R1HAL5_9GAMM|nr:OmpA family protein [Thiogranum longum]TCK18984.1 OOP family OmpA-OmpF porin [Thiogranum longum]